MTGRSILITGCSSGIGHDAAHGLMRAGWRVFATCRKETDCARLRAEGLESFRLDYSDAASIAGAVLIPVLTIVDGAPWPVWIGACAASALVLFEHRENLARLRGGREARLGDGRRR